MIVSALMALLFHRLKQPLVIGYIVAGIIIGPNTYPGALVLHLDVVNSLAQVGVTMLLFVVGLEFPTEKLAGTFRKVLTIAGAKVGGTFFVAYAVAFALKFTLYDSLFAALAITVTSTVVVSKVLAELGLIREEAASLVISISIVEDVIVLTALAALQSVALVGNPSFSGLGYSLGLVLLFIGGTLVIGSKIVPKLMNWVGDYRQDELIVLMMLGIAFGLSIIASEIGISVATGAFLAGVLVARSSYHETTKILATPLRDMFAALFFVSMGALMNVSSIQVFFVPALILVFVSISVKLFTVLGTSRALKFSGPVSLKTALGLSGSSGELGLVVAKGGSDVGVTSAFLLPMIGVVTLITTFLSAFVIRAGWKAAEGTDDSRGKSRAEDNEITG